MMWRCCALTSSNRSHALAHGAARRTGVALIACTAVIAAACEPAAQQDGSVEAVPVALFPDDPGRRGFGPLRYAGGLVLTGEAEAFGGWSAMEVSPDGDRLLAISDSGSWMTGRLIFDDEGQLSGLSGVSISPMLDEAGSALSGERADAEGLAALGEGRFAVSFEREHRIAVYDIAQDWSGLAEARAEAHPGAPGADRLRANAGAEAMARIGDTLWVGIEDPIVDGQPTLLWRFDLTRPDTPPQSAALILTPGFGLTGLTSDGDGGLLVLERFWSRDVGNRIRIGRLAADVLETAEGPMTPRPLAAFEPDMTVDNFEAVALAEIAGERRLFLMSDDNFNDAQRTLLLSFTWPDPAGD